MKITKEQLRQIIKEELAGDSAITESPSLHAMANRDMKASKRQAEEAWHRLGVLIKTRVENPQLQAEMEAELNAFFKGYRGHVSGINEMWRLSEIPHDELGE